MRSFHRSTANARFAVDPRRVAALAFTFAAHAIAVGLFALPDTRELAVRTAAQALPSEQDRLTLRMELAPLAPPPPAPVPATPVRTEGAIPEPPAAEAPAEAAPAPVPSAPVLRVKAVPPPPIAVAAPAPIAAAAPAPSASTTAAPATDRAQAQRERDAYIRALMAALLQHRSYPPEARRQRARGVVQLRFTVGRDGQVLAANVARSAGHRVLDQAALAVLAAADPLPAIPPSLGRDTLTVTVPVEYALITR